MINKTVVIDRMKRYSSSSKQNLMRGVPVILHINGKSFHSYAKNFQKPFDEVLLESMRKSILYLCKHIQGCVFGYTQSDKISLLLIDYQTHHSDAWYDYDVQKICSDAAAMSTMIFNKIFREQVALLSKEDAHETERLYSQKIGLAKFMVHAYNVPKNDVCNYFIWKQNDCRNNSVMQVGKWYLDANELNGCSIERIQEKLLDKHQIDWNDYPIHLQRGSCCIKTRNVNEHGKWIIDMNPPIFAQDRDYIERFVY